MSQGAAPFNFQLSKFELTAVNDQDTSKLRLLRKQGSQWTFSIGGERYRTDAQGDGLFHTNAVSPNCWRVDAQGTRHHVVEPRQIVGVCDFSLRGYSVSGARAKVKRHFGLVREL